MKLTRKKEWRKILVMVPTVVVAITAMVFLLKMLTPPGELKSIAGQTVMMKGADGGLYKAWMFIDHTKTAITNDDLKAVYGHACLYQDSTFADVVSSVELNKRSTTTLYIGVSYDNGFSSGMKCYEVAVSPNFIEPVELPDPAELRS